MILRPTHSRVIMPAAITARDPTARYSAMRGPTVACGSDQNNGQPIKRQQKNTATMGESRIDAPASSRPMLCEQTSPITAPNVPEMNMQTQ
jgi:hypothetical protein